MAKDTGPLGGKEPGDGVFGSSQPLVISKAAEYPEGRPER